MDALGFVAAPLLAGAAIATIGVLGTDATKFRWPAPTMMVLTLAAVALLASIQVALRARRFLYNNDELRAWTPMPDEQDPEQVATRVEVARARALAQQRDFARWLWLSERASWAYQAGVVLLGLGLASLLAPPAGASVSDAVFRWIAVGSVICAILIHVVVIIRRILDEAESLTYLLGAIIHLP
jgi:hypothetical protein